MDGFNCLERVFIFSLSKPIFNALESADRALKISPNLMSDDENDITGSHEISMHLVLDAEFSV